MRLCADCLENPSSDQRAATQNGRCRYCTRGLIRDARKREKAKGEHHAEEAAFALYELQGATRGAW